MQVRVRRGRRTLWVTGYQCCQEQNLARSRKTKQHSQGLAQFQCCHGENQARSKIRTRMLEGEPGQKQNRKNSAHNNWLPMLIRKETDKRKKTMISICNFFSTFQSTVLCDYHSTFRRSPLCCVATSLTHAYRGLSRSEGVRLFPASLAMMEKLPF